MMAQPACLFPEFRNPEVQWITQSELWASIKTRHLAHALLWVPHVNRTGGLTGGFILQGFPRDVMEARRGWVEGEQIAHITLTIPTSKLFMDTFDLLPACGGNDGTVVSGLEDAGRWIEFEEAVYRGDDFSGVARNIRPLIDEISPTHMHTHHHRPKVARLERLYLCRQIGHKAKLLRKLHATRF